MGGRRRTFERFAMRHVVPSPLGLGKKGRPKAIIANDEGALAAAPDTS
jgi:hypothetical protein